MDPLLAAEGAGERGELKELPPGVGVEIEYPACFDRMGMGDPEIVDLEDDHLMQEQSQPRRQPRYGFCCTEFKPPSDSDEEGVREVLCAHDVADQSAPAPAPAPAPASAGVAVSQLSVTPISWISLQPDQISVSVATSDTSSVREDDEDDEVCHEAPTPDNTPEHTPAEELHRTKPHILEPGPKSELFASLMKEQQLAQSQTQPLELELEPGGAGAGAGSSNTLGKVWGKILGLSTRKQHLKHEQYKRDDDSDDSDEAGLDEMSQRIEELESTLEEVELDGDIDDPVVSYLVEEVEDGTRHSRAARELVVEEVRDEDSQPPAPKMSGLLARIFTRSRTCQEIPHPNPVPSPAPTPAPAPSISKRAKTEPRASRAQRDRLLHRILHNGEKKRPASILHTGDKKRAANSEVEDASINPKQQSVSDVKLVADFGSQTEESCFVEYAPIRRLREHMGILGLGSCSTSGSQKPPDYVDLI